LKDSDVELKAQIENHEKVVESVMEERNQTISYIAESLGKAVTVSVPRPPRSSVVSVGGFTSNEGQSGNEEGLQAGRRRVSLGTLASSATRRLSLTSVRNKSWLVSSGKKENFSAEDGSGESITNDSSGTASASSSNGSGVHLQDKSENSNTEKLDAHATAPTATLGTTPTVVSRLQKNRMPSLAEDEELLQHQWTSIKMKVESEVFKKSRLPEPPLQSINNKKILETRRISAASFEVKPILPPISSRLPIDGHVNQKLASQCTQPEDKPNFHHQNLAASTGQESNSYEGEQKQIDDESTKQPDDESQEDQGKEPWDASLEDLAYSYRSYTHFFASSLSTVVWCILVCTPLTA
jgi:hypothetical protein